MNNKDVKHTKVVVKMLDAFRVSTDGIHNVSTVKGQEIELPIKVALGLVRDRQATLVKELEGTELEQGKSIHADQVNAVKAANRKEPQPATSETVNPLAQAVDKENRQTQNLETEKQRQAAERDPAFRR